MWSYFSTLKGVAEFWSASGCEMDEVSGSGGLRFASTTGYFLSALPGCESLKMKRDCDESSMLIPLKRFMNVSVHAFTT